jgi:hypothetical protein
MSLASASDSSYFGLHSSLAVQSAMNYRSVSTIRTAAPDLPLFPDTEVEAGPVVRDRTRQTRDVITDAVRRFAASRYL